MMQRIHHSSCLPFVTVGRSIRAKGTQSMPMPSTDQVKPKEIAEAALTLEPLEFVPGSKMSVENLAAVFSNFKEPKSYFREKILEGHRELQDIYAGNSSVQDTFRQLFPDLVQSRGTTLLQNRDCNKELFTRWEENKNDVTIELADESTTTEQNAKQESKDALFIGGPSTLTACLLYQLRYPSHRVQHAFADRFDSNYDGSAYYYHQRDAAPVYINRVNRGPYCVYIDLYKRLISPAKLAHLAETDRHHVKISLNWSNIKPRYLFTIFIPNFWHMALDLWIKNKKSAKMAHVIQHSCRTVPIVETISKCTGMPVETMLIHGKNKANYVGLVGAKKGPKSHFTWLNKFAYIPFEEISREGFGTTVTQVLNFPNDGLIAPMIIDNLKKEILEQVKKNEPEATLSTVSRPCFQLRKLFVQPMSPDNRTRMRITSVEWLDTSEGTTHRMNVDRVFLSLGPSARVKITPPTLTWTKHAIGCLSKSRQQFALPANVTGGYKPTFSSLWRHTLNGMSNTFFRGTHCLKDFMWASGSSSVMLLGIDLTQTDPAQLDVFSRFVDGVNQHWTLIAQRDVSLPASSNANSPIKTYRFFAIQMTGGGHFPSRLVPPDYVLNLLHTTEKMYGLDVMKHAVYDIVQTRGCARGVSAQNTIAIENLADNAVVSYALGGIGMSTMFPNGEKMVQMVEQHDRILQKTAEKKMTLTEHVLNDIDYSFLTGETQRMARSLGFDDTMSSKEKKVVMAAILAILIVMALTVPTKSKKLKEHEQYKRKIPIPIFSFS